jgi:hypothetical protein
MSLAEQSLGLDRDRGATVSNRTWRSQAEPNATASGGNEEMKLGVIASSLLCLLAISSCSNGSDTAASHGVSTTWYQKGYHFAQLSVAKGVKAGSSDTAINLAKSDEGDRLSWCDSAYAPSGDPAASSRKTYYGVFTNAPSLGIKATTATMRSYSQWIEGCAAGLHTAQRG